MKLPAFLIFLSVALAGCGNIGESIGDAVAEQATEKILDEVEASINVKDAFIDGLDHVWVTFGELRIQNESGQWTDVENDVARVDLLAYQLAGESVEIARFNIWTGNYTALEMPILDVEAIKDGSSLPLQIHTEVLRIDSFFDVFTEFSALIDFDLDESFDDEGNFHAAVKDVQISSQDADGDGIDDFRDTDDDGDGILDHEDDDVDGDGRDDAPSTRPESFREDDQKEFQRAPPRKAGQERIEAEKFGHGQKQQGASGEVVDTHLVSFPDGHLYELHSIRWYADCVGRTAGEVVVRGWDSRNNLEFQTLPFDHPCGWIDMQLGVTVDGTTGASIEVDSNQTRLLDYVDYSARPAPQIERSAEIVEGESSTNGERRNIAIPTGMARQDAVDPVRSDDTVTPWNFTLDGFGTYAGSIWIDIACNENADVVGVGFAYESLPWDGSWSVVSFICGQGYQEFALPGSVEAGDFQLFVRYDFDAGPLSIDSMLFQPE